MPDRTFLPSVAPIAATLREGRHELVRTAQKFLPEMWTLPSPLPDWSYKDLLAHLASGDWVFQWMLRGALGQDKFDIIERGFEYVNEGNALRIAERKERSVEELLAELTADAENTLDLLAQLTDDVDLSQTVGRRPNGDPVTIEQWIQGFPQHDINHGTQLKSALDNVMM